MPEPKKRVTYAKKVIEAGKVTFRFPSLGKELVVEKGDVPAAMWDHAAAHGIGQKVGDKYSASAGVTSAEQAFDVASTMIAAIKAGNWSDRAMSDYIADEHIQKAIAKMKGKTLEQVLEVWNNLAEKNPAKLEEIRQDSRTRETAKAIRAAERAAEAKEAEGLWDDFD